MLSLSRSQSVEMSVSAFIYSPVNEPELYANISRTLETFSFQTAVHFRERVIADHLSSNSKYFAPIN